MSDMQTSQGSEYVAPIHLTAAAGGLGGSWYVLLEGLANLIHEVCPALTITVVEGGGVLNHALVGSGQLPMAILNPPMTVAALAGRSPFDRAFPDLRVGVANLTTNYLQCMVNRACPVHTLHEWLQGRTPLRVPVDRVGTVDRMVFELTLQHFGVSAADVEHWGSRLVPAVNYHEQLALYQADAVDVLWQFMAIPSPAIQAAHALRPLNALALPPALIATLEGLGWTAAQLPAGAYGIVAESVATVAMGTSLGFHASVPTDVVFAITHALCEHPERVRNIHPAARQFDPAQAPLQAGAPLHPGAERYFRNRVAYSSK
jgi:TRAP transporter TAXI family solute receptor